MNHSEGFTKLIVIILSIFIMVPFGTIFAKAYNDAIVRGSNVYDLYTVGQQRNDSFALYHQLLDDGWIENGVSFKDFDYICVLTQQLCTMTEHVTPDIALAMIAVESRFDQNAKSGSARGLMQLIPIYHTKRMEQFVEADHVVDLEDFFDPRLNIMTGLDYIDYILTETDGDFLYSLMWYNQGAVSASSDYLDNLRVSGYARDVMALAREIKTFLE